MIDHVADPVSVPSAPRPGDAPLGRSGATASPLRRDPVAEALRALTYDIDHRLDPGDVAALRRGDRGSASPAFWRMVVEHLEPRDLVSAGNQAVDGVNVAERRWTVIMAALARSRGLRGPATLGAALAMGAVAEMRVLRLLNATGDAIEGQVRSTVHQLERKAILFDPLHLAQLILFDDGPGLGSLGDNVRRRIARDFYRTSQREARTA